MNTNTTVNKRKPNGKPLRPKAERVYVRVVSDFDATGYMLPRSIIWDDGREFHISASRTVTVKMLSCAVSATRKVLPCVIGMDISAVTRRDYGRR